MNGRLHLHKVGEGSPWHSENATVPRGWDNGGKQPQMKLWKGQWEVLQAELSMAE